MKLFEIMQDAFPCGRNIQAYICKNMKYAIGEICRLVEKCFPPENGKCNSAREKCISPVSRSLAGELMTEGISLSGSSIAAPLVII